MRWLFLEPGRRSDAARKERYIRLIDRWWQEFADESQALIDALDRPEAQLFAERLQERLERIDDRLCWEVGPGAKGRPHRLVITPETDMELRPLTATLLERAPELAGWEFYSHRLAETAEMLAPTLEHRVGRTPQDLRAFVEPAPGRKLALRFASPDFAETDDEPMELDCAAAFVAAETLLGEEFVDQWIAYVGVEPAQADGRDALELLFGRRARQAGFAPGELREACWNAAAALRDQSPDEPYFRRPGTLSWTPIEPKPNGLAHSENGSPPRATDPCEALLSIRTLDRELSAAFAEPLFFSANWSRSGETFCRLKLSAPDDRPLELDRMAHQIEGTLRSASQGCVVAVAKGALYGYVDLAIVDLPAAAQTLRKFGRSAVAGRCIGPSSWLLFHDAYLSGEWVGLADDSPAPEGMA